MVKKYKTYKHVFMTLLFNTVCTRKTFAFYMLTYK